QCVGAAVLAELGAQDAVAAPAFIRGACEDSACRAAEGSGGGNDLLANQARHGFRHWAAQRRSRGECDAPSILEHHGIQADDIFGAAGARTDYRRQGRIKAKSGVSRSWQAEGTGGVVDAGASAATARTRVMAASDNSTRASL